MYPGCPSPFFCKSAYIINQSFLEQVSQCSTITLFRVYWLLATWWGFRFPIPSTVIKDMRIGFHLHGHSVMILHHLLSQQAVKFPYAEPLCKEEHLWHDPKKANPLSKPKAFIYVWVKQNMKFCRKKLSQQTWVFLILSRKRHLDERYVSVSLPIIIGSDFTRCLNFR